MKKILIIDDDNLIRKLSRDRLENSGYTVVEAEDGERGIERTKTECPDLILLDIAMPGIDGLEICRKIKADKNTIDIPIIMHTSLEETKLIEIALDAGAVDYIIKPANEAQLILRINMNIELREEVRRRQDCEKLLTVKDAELKAAYEDIESLGGVIEEAEVIEEE